MIIYDNQYINGAWQTSQSEASVDVINPSTEEEIGQVVMGDAHDVDRAVTAAQQAAESWARTTVAERSKWLAEISAALAAKQDRIAEIISLEMGMPLKLSRLIQAGLPIATFDSYAKLVRDFQFESTQGTTRILREPIGVCGFITPWNYPLHQIAGKVAPALAAGCTVVLKPSQIAPLNAFLLAEIIDDVGLPAGVFNLVSGAGSVVGKAIAAHPGIAAVSLTGSTAAGIQVAQSGAQNIKRVTLELGGKSANLILEDADLNKAVVKGVQNCFLNSGQTCSAQTRMLVPRQLQAQVVEIAKQAAERMTLGDAFAETTVLGPMVDADQRHSVRTFIQKGIDEGARLVTGGPESPAEIKRGYFVKPTVFADVTPAMTIAQEEIFGPVLAILPYEDDADAVRIANDSIYGLSGAVWSQDKARAQQVARQLKTGQVFINGAGFDIRAPFGGYKQSGNGREFGTFGLEEFLETKAVMGFD